MFSLNGGDRTGRFHCSFHLISFRAGSYIYFMSVNIFRLVLQYNSNHNSLIQDSTKTSPYGILYVLNINIQLSCLTNSFFFKLMLYSDVFLFMEYLFANEIRFFLLDYSVYG